MDALEAACTTICMKGRSNKEKISILLAKRNFEYEKIKGT